MNIAQLLVTLPAFLAYLATAAALLALYCILYTAVTPHAEWRLLREGNVSAALAFGGSLLGFVLPLASAIAHSVSLVDCVLWGAIALVVQIAAFFAARILLPGLPGRIERDERGSATFAAIFFLATGLLNAACLTW